MRPVRGSAGRADRGDRERLLDWDRRPVHKRQQRRTCVFRPGQQRCGGRRNAHPRPSHSRLQGITMLTLIEETGRMSAPDYILSAFLGCSLGFSVAVRVQFCVDHLTIIDRGHGQAPSMPGPQGSTRSSCAGSSRAETRSEVMWPRPPTMNRRRPLRTTPPASRTLTQALFGYGPLE